MMDDTKEVRKEVRKEVPMEFQVGSETQERRRADDQGRPPAGSS